MLYLFLADTVLLIHLIFIGFVGCGGILALRWPRLALAHLPTLAWGFAISIGRWVCPLTPLENWLRRSGGEPGYGGEFVDQYISPLVYPPGLTPSAGLWIATWLAVLNLAAYALLLARIRTSSTAPGGGLCQTCAHAERIISDRDSNFLLCRLSRTNDQYCRYPRLPVLVCDGHTPADRPTNSGTTVTIGPE